MAFCDWSSDVCSSDLGGVGELVPTDAREVALRVGEAPVEGGVAGGGERRRAAQRGVHALGGADAHLGACARNDAQGPFGRAGAESARESLLSRTTESRADFDGKHAESNCHLH